MAALPTTPGSSKYFPSLDDEVPIIDVSEEFSDVVRKLSIYIAAAVESAYTYEQLRTSVAGQNLRPLLHSLSEECHHPALVAALLASRYLFISADNDDDGLSESRGLACELVAWQFLTFLSEKELIDYLLYELPRSSSGAENPGLRTQRQNGNGSPILTQEADESTSLLPQEQDVNYNNFHPPERDIPSSSSATQMDESGPSRLVGEDPAEALAGMNALEIAAVANAKKFMSQKPVQKIVEDIWVRIHTSIQTSSPLSGYVHSFINFCLHKLQFPDLCGNGHQALELCLYLTPTPDSLFTSGICVFC
jgi:hypothetical protein